MPLTGTEPSDDLISFDTDVQDTRTETLPRDSMNSTQETLPSFNDSPNSSMRSLSPGRLDLNASQSTESLEKSQELKENTLDVDTRNVNEKDHNGSTALHHASASGNSATVSSLLADGADKDSIDSKLWTPLMWATFNNHLEVVKLLLEAHAETGLKNADNQTAFDLITDHDSETYQYLLETGFIIAENSLLGSTLYHPPVEPEAPLMPMFDKTPMFSSMDMDTHSPELEEFDTSLDIDIETPDLTLTNFDWETFKIKDSLALPRELIPDFLDQVITEYKPSLNSGKPSVSADAMFLASRYFFYCGTSESFTEFLSPIIRRIELCVQEKNKVTDLAYLSYWLANSEILLYYLRKDKGMESATKQDFQPAFEQLIRNIINLVEHAASVIIDPLLEPCLLDYDSIPEYGKVQYKDEWKLFKSKLKLRDDRQDVAQKHMMPPTQESLIKRPRPSKITSILSSILLLFQMFSVHPETQLQILAKLLYKKSCFLFNKLVGHGKKRYLNRRRAIQVRLNTSVIEDWCRNNNFRPENIEIDNKIYRFKSLGEVGTTFLQPLTSILAWLQTFTALVDVSKSNYTKDSNDSSQFALDDFKALNPRQLLHTASHYRYETDETRLSKEYKRQLQAAVRDFDNENVTRQLERTALGETDTDTTNHQKNKDDDNNDTNETSDSAETNEGNYGNEGNDPNDTSSSDIDIEKGKNRDYGSAQLPFSYSNITSDLTKCYILSTYQLPVSEELQLDPNILGIDYVPSLADCAAFWGDKDVSGLTIKQGAKYLVPTLQPELAESLNILEAEYTKDVPQDEQVVEEPVSASKKPVQGDESFEDLNPWADSPW